MRKLRVSEVFYSLQGEGARKGSANIFVRLAHCNLACRFCDTESEEYHELTLHQLLTRCRRFPCKNVVFTGGEPLLQLTGEEVRVLKREGYHLAVETNGTRRPPKELDWITLSPKVAGHVLLQNFKGVRIDELKYVRNTSQRIPRPRVKADHYYLSPEFDGDSPNWANIEHCIELVKGNPQWKLSVQEHKLLKIR